MVDVVRLAVAGAALSYLAMVMMAVLGITLFQVNVYVMDTRKGGYGKLARTAVANVAQAGIAAVKKTMSPRNLLEALRGSAAAEKAKAQKQTAGRRRSNNIPVGHALTAGVVAIGMVVVVALNLVVSAVLLAEDEVDRHPKVRKLVQASLGMQVGAQLVAQLAVAALYRDFDDDQSDELSQKSDVAHAAVAFAVYAASAGLLTEAATTLRKRQ